MVKKLRKDVTDLAIIGGTIGVGSMIAATAQEGSGVNVTGAFAPLASGFGIASTAVMGMNTIRIVKSFNKGKKNKYSRYF